MMQGGDETIPLEQLVVTNDKLLKNQGNVILNEDCELKLTLGVNKISVYVYANRTFKEDIMLFYNDISLRKPLQTDNVSSFAYLIHLLAT
jgi:hypothetical protein